MDILCVSDVHGDFETLKRITALAGDFDLVVVAGDLTNFYSSVAALHMIDELQAKAADIVIVPGNCDLNETSELYKGLGISLHGTGRVIGDVGFFGVGGSNRTPFNTPLEYEEEEITAMLEEGHEKVKDCGTKILVSHAPPVETVDKTSSGVNAGSRAVRDFLEETPVDLVICGHIHEAQGTGQIGKTTIINTGPAQEGYVKITIDDDTGKVTYEFMRY